MAGMKKIVTKLSNIMKHKLDYVDFIFIPPFI